MRFAIPPTPLGDPVVGDFAAQWFSCLGDDRCTLAPILQRYPGLDNGVTTADKEFLDEERPDWWLRKLGKR